MKKDIEDSMQTIHEIKKGNDWCENKGYIGLQDLCENKGYMGMQELADYLKEIVLTG